MDYRWQDKWAACDFDSTLKHMLFLSILMSTHDQPCVTVMFKLTKWMKVMNLNNEILKTSLHK